jgi:hypothetical protein
MNKVRVNSKYTYQPVGMDVWSPCTTLKAGDVVTVVNLRGCPPANTMGMCYVNFNGKFAGLVLCNSLQKITKGK